MDLVEFLRARLDEDERVAKAVAFEHASFRRLQDETSDAVSSLLVRYDPAFVLAEVKAKRAILDLHEIEPGFPPVMCDHGVHTLGAPPRCAECNNDTVPCQTIRLLAAVWAYHPDYDQEWTP